MSNNDYIDRELYNELYEIICEIVCIKHETVRIGGEVYPYELVKARFLSLNSAHLQYGVEVRVYLMGVSSLLLPHES